MPFVKLHTNVFMDPTVEKEIAAKLSTLTVELLGKGVDWVMAEAKGNQALVYGGSDAPAAFVELKSIGLKSELCPSLAAAICKFMESELSIAPNRVYIEFKDLERALFGWDGKTFG